jgi:hypothetical protein
MGTTQSSITRIEGGGSLATLDMLARLAHATGTPCALPPRHHRRRSERSRLNCPGLSSPAVARAHTP